MNSTTTPLGNKFAEDIVGIFMKTFDDGKKQAAHVIWSSLMSFLSQHLVLVILSLIVILFFSWLQAFTMGKWGWFGSVLYHYLYLGTLFIVGLICGPEIFVSSLFDILAIILYILCLLLVGIILDKTGLRKPWQKRSKKYNK